ncbi:MAG: endo-1,4-beta-xylanase, partial [Oscillospiraceae bacterium]|nr:endo-1,4-beta-xylanase [Oscillospiraceae bacterium]
GGSGSMTLGEGATFKAEWSASVSRGNFLARRGLDFGSKKKATDYEYIGLDYEANYKQTGSASGNSRLCVYGWFQNQGAAGNPPLVEYYIIEDWVDWCPDGNGKIVTIDGAQYKIFQMDHTGPSINSGSETFKQYFSVRQSKRTSGHITVSDHFKAWANEGWGIGNLYEVALNAEGWQSSGVADITMLDVYTDPSKAPGASSTTPIQNTTAPTYTETTKTTTSGGASVIAQPSGDIASHQNNDYTYDKSGNGFKDKMGPYFRLGTAVSGFNIGKQDVQQFILKNFNSITCENEMKPDSICKQYLSSGDNIGVDLSGADAIMSFCEKNGIGMRGHTFVWYSQTPSWIFKENFQDGGQTVSKDRMNKRLESMIKNTFDWIKEHHPNLKLYAYDVCNELFKNDGGGFRGDGGEYSDWWSCYHSDEFVIKAFEYARKYAPSDCKLYMNDYNEYFKKKTDDLYNMAAKILEAGPYIDGIGMQSHMHAVDFGKTGSAHENKDSNWNSYAEAIDKFNSLGLDVQITELDVTNCAAKTGSDLFVDIFRAAMERSTNISSLTLWGHCDSASWRNSYEDGGKPLPFDGSCQPKAFYNDIIALTETVRPGEAVQIQATTAAETTTTTQETTTTQTTAGGSQVTKKGDVNCDGKITVSDAIMLARIVAEDTSVKVTDTGKANAEMDGVEGLSSDDTNELLKTIAGMK